MVGSQHKVRQHHTKHESIYSVQECWNSTYHFLQEAATETRSQLSDFSSLLSLLRSKWSPSPTNAFLGVLVRLRGPSGYRRLADSLHGSLARLSTLSGR